MKVYYKEEGCYSYMKEKFKHVNQNLKWISVDIDPVKPKDFDGNLFHCVVICNIAYESGVIEYERDFVDYDFETKEWKCSDGCEVLFWFPLPDEFDKKNLMIAGN